jgi:hypothetical protein
MLLNILSWLLPRLLAKFWVAAWVEDDIAPDIIDDPSFNCLNIISLAVKGYISGVIYLFAASINPRTNCLAIMTNWDFDALIYTLN